MRRTLFFGQHNCRPPELFDQACGNDAQHTAMPTATAENEYGFALVPESREDLAEDPCLFVLTSPVDLF